MRLLPLVLAVVVLAGCVEDEEDLIAEAVLKRDWEWMVAFYGFPKEHWKHIRTTNVVESPFSSVRLRTNAARRYKKVSYAMTLIWKVLMVA